jgi:hypothetical protein
MPVTRVREAPGGAIGPGPGRRLHHADELAWRLGTDCNIGWTWFGPTNVMIHRVSAAVALGEPAG